MNQKVIFFCIAIFALSCSSKSRVFDYDYQDIVEIYAVTSYISDQKKIMTLLSDKYNLINFKNQIHYRKKLQSIGKDSNNWNQFIKDSVNFYINLDKEYLINHYSLEGYEKKFDKFNDNNIVDPQGSNIANYWKVYYLKDKLPNKFMMVKEKYENNKPILKVYYTESRTKIKEIHSNGNKKTIYFDFDRKIIEKNT